MLGSITTKQGCVSWSLWKRNSNPYIVIYHLYVIKRFRRKGLAKLLLQSAINLIKLQYPKLEIVIKPEPMENSISIDCLTKFYKSLGLTIVYYE